MGNKWQAHVARIVDTLSLLEAQSLPPGNVGDFIATWTHMARAPVDWAHL